MGGTVVPKRSDQRRRRNKPTMEITEAASKSKTHGPGEPDPSWHPIAKEFWSALDQSGQAEFYEESDWALARYVTEAMSRSLQTPGKISPTLFAAVTSAMGDLLISEGARRRLRLELSRVEAPAPPSKSIMTRYAVIAGKKVG